MGGTLVVLGNRDQSSTDAAQMRLTDELCSWLPDLTFLLFMNVLRHLFLVTFYQNIP